MKLYPLMGFLIATSFLSPFCFAADSIAKEETTPPAPYEAIAAEDIAPIMSFTKPLGDKPSPPTIQDTSPASVPNSSENRVDELMQHNVRQFF